MFNDKKNLKVCLVGASFGTNNMGVNALTVGTLKAYFNQYPDGELFLLDYGKEGVSYNIHIGSRIVSVQLVNIRFSKKFYLKNNIAFLILLAIVARGIPSGRMRRKLISGNFWLNQVAESDIVASMAGGDSFSDIYGLGRFFYVSLPQLLALFIGKKLVLLPQTIGPFKGKIAGFISEFIMRKARVVYSRDYQSIEYAKNILSASGHNNGEVRFSYDVGFLLDPVKPKSINVEGFIQKNDGKTIVGLNVSGLLYMGGYTGNNMFDLNIDYPKFVRNLISFLIKEKNVTVLLVPHVFGSHSESDSSVCNRIYEEFASVYGESIRTVKGDFNQNEIKYVIGLCDFFIGSRMHACIAALSQNIPAVGLAYSKKFLGVYETIGCEALVADIRKMDKVEILKCIGNAYDNREVIRRQLEEKMPAVKDATMNLFRDIEEICEHSA